jgi:peptidyl-dipeptidase Dcp
MANVLLNKKVLKMKIPTLLLLVSGLLLWSCSKTEQNPFYSEYDTAFQVPPFDKIKEEHYLPAFKEGMKQHQAEIAVIVNNAEAPTLMNTVEALEKSGSLLTRVSSVFYSLLSANTNDTMQSIAEEVAPLLSKHQDDILLNEKLFERIKIIYDRRDDLNLNSEQQRLLEKGYKAFVRGGANLDEAKKARLREINEELSTLTLTFGKNVLKETNNFEMVIDNEEDLAGLPENVISSAAEAAKERGHEGKWVFTIHKPSMIPFLQYSEKRDLREKIFKAYTHMGDNDNEFDNKKIASRIAALRVERANLLGYNTHADFVLEENMAKTPEKVYELLNQFWEPALKVAQQEADEMQKMIYAEGNDFKLQPWDWWYYAEKVKKAKYDLDDEQLRPYFQLENVRQGVWPVNSMVSPSTNATIFQNITPMWRFLK